MGLIFRGWGLGYGYSHLAFRCPLDNAPLFLSAAGGFACLARELQRFGLIIHAMNTQRFNSG